MITNVTNNSKNKTKKGKPKEQLWTFLLEQAGSTTNSVEYIAPNSTDFETSNHILNTTTTTTTT